MHRRRGLIAATLAAVISGLLTAPADAQDEPLYYLPAASETALSVWQGTGDGPGRTPNETHAFDFVAADGPARFEVVAARGGTVLSSRGGVVGGRCEAPLDGPPPDCWRVVDYLLIDHGDGTSGLYSHLQRGSLQVRSGDVVSVGQPLADAGRSGWTDHIGLRFAVQPTPTWDVRGKGGWFQTESQPISFADPDVATQRPDGVPQTDDLIISGNPGPAFTTFRFHRRPGGLPAAVPLEKDVGREISAAYEVDSPDGYGLHFAPGQVLAEVRPVFGGRLAYAGCAGGVSSSLGRTVILEFDLQGTPYLAVHGHLTGIAPALLELDPDLPLPIVGPLDTIGRHGPIDETEVECPASGPHAEDLFIGILRGATVSAEGEIIGGTPVSPEPLVGERAYEGFSWWSGPVVGAEVLEVAGRPRVRWNDATPASGSHIRYGQPLTLKARVRDVAEIEQVRFRLWYPRWPQVEPSRDLTSFDPDGTWREIAVCAAPGGDPLGYASLCRWDGDALDAKVTYVWDPTLAKPQLSAPWLPRARAATSLSQSACVPVSLAVEVIDRAGHVHSEVASLPTPRACDDSVAEASDGARVLYLDPLVPPRAPASRGTEDRGWPPVYGPDPLKGAIVWRDRSDNEDGFRIYVRRHWFEPDCSVAKGSWERVASVKHNKERYRPKHEQILQTLPEPDQSDVPGYLSYWEYAVSAYNSAGETQKVPVGGFLGGSEAFCDQGVGPPPELEG